MKKKLLTSLICLAGSPFAMADFPDYDYTLSIDDVATQTIPLDTTEYSYSITTLLDVEKLRAAVESGGSSNDIVRYTIYISSNGSSVVMRLNIKDGKVNIHWGSNSNASMGDSLASVVNWDNVYAAAITYAHDSTVGSSYCLSLWSHGANGLSETYVEDSNVKFSAPITQVSLDFNNVIGQTAYVFYGQKLSATDAKEANLIYIPEPATATLSLLALAGMASRRRRK